MAHKLIRHYGRGHLHFITFTCYRRLPLLRSIRARNAFVQILGETRDRYGFSLVGYVVMPEHIHLLLSEPAKGTPSTVIQVLKQRVSRRLHRKRGAPAGQLNLIFASSDDSLPRYWQRRFYDFNVWSLKKRVEKLHYVHMNPLKRKLVDHPKEWLCSSYSFYSKLKHGFIRVDPIKGYVHIRNEKPNPPPLRKTAKERPPGNSRPSQKVCHPPCTTEQVFLFLPINVVVNKYFSADPSMLDVHQPAIGA